jgi:tRNA(Ile)-lysidine synthase
MNLVDQFETFIQKNELINHNDRILIGVSGGIDSVCLFHLFLIIKNKWNLSLAVIHVNHGWRGKNADLDEAFVRELARKNRLICYSQKVDARGYAIKHKLSPEEGARVVRFKYFNDIINRTNYDLLALAHHADDQAETILMNMIRGTGIRGLGGIYPRREKIIHPLLFATREQIENYVNINGLKYVTDKSNLDTRYLRNRIRLNIISKLKQDIGQHIVSTFCRTGDAARETQTYLENESNHLKQQVICCESKNEIVLDIDKFLDYFKIIQKTLIIQIIDQILLNTRRINSKTIERILQLAENGRSGNILKLGIDLTVIRSGNKLIFTRLDNNPLRKITVKVGEPVNLSNIGIKFQSTNMELNKYDVVFSDNRNIEYLDFDKINFPLHLRPVRNGDWFIPLGMHNKKKLQDFFIDERIPNYQRARVPLLTSSDHILWVVGLRIDDRYKITCKTKNILKVEITKFIEGKDNKNG